MSNKTAVIGSSLWPSKRQVLTRLMVPTRHEFPPMEQASNSIRKWLVVTTVASCLVKPYYTVQDLFLSSTLNDFSSSVACIAHYGTMKDTSRDKFSDKLWFLCVLQPKYVGSAAIEFYHLVTMMNLCFLGASLTN